MTSPPLPDIGDKSVAVPIPPGWEISTLDTNAWIHHRRSGDFTFIKIHPINGVSSEIDVEVGNDNLGIELEKAGGAFTGSRFQTITGLRGVFSSKVYDNNRRFWYLEIPYPSKNGMAWVSLTKLPGDINSQRRLAMWIFRRVKFVRSSHRAHSFGTTTSLAFSSTAYLPVRRSGSEGTAMKSSRDNSTMAPQGVHCK